MWNCWDFNNWNDKIIVSFIVDNNHLLKSIKLFLYKHFSVSAHMILTVSVQKNSQFTVMLTVEPKTIETPFKIAEVGKLGHKINFYQAMSKKYLIKTV